VPDLSEAIRQHTEVLGLEVVMDIGWVAFLADGSAHTPGPGTVVARPVCCAQPPQRRPGGPPLRR
jgi:hypothetical protein